MADPHPLLLVASCLALTPFIAGAPLLDRLPAHGREVVASAAGGVGLSYVFLYLLAGLAAGGGTMLHGWLPLGQGPHQTLFLVMLASACLACLTNAAAAQLARPALAYGYLAGAAMLYALLAGVGLVDEAEAGPGAFLLYLAALGPHMVCTERFLAHKAPEAVHVRVRWALCAMPVLGGALALASGMGHEAMDAFLAMIAGGMVVNILLEELPAPGHLQIGPFVAAVVGYAGLIVATWHL